MRQIRVDWFRITAELQSLGYSLERIATEIDVPKSTIMGWRTLDAEPRHAAGESLIALWCKAHDMPRDALPLNVGDLLQSMQATTPA